MPLFRRRCRQLLCNEGALWDLLTVALSKMPLRLRFPKEKQQFGDLYGFVCTKIRRYFFKNKKIKKSKVVKLFSLLAQPTECWFLPQLFPLASCKVALNLMMV